VVKIRGVQVVKEQTADAALLLAVLEIEVIIAPFFIARIDFFAERQTQIAGGTMPVDGILFKAVVGVKSKPPPNHHTGSAPGFSAIKNRTLAWLVGTNGFSG
jgi:hypothetical protein